MELRPAVLAHVEPVPLVSADQPTACRGGELVAQCFVYSIELGSIEQALAPRALVGDDRQLA